jgi:hypothetical protein
MDLLWGLPRVPVDIIPMLMDRGMQISDAHATTAESILLDETKRSSGIPRRRGTGRTTGPYPRCSHNELEEKQWQME